MLRLDFDRGFHPKRSNASIPWISEGTGVGDFVQALDMDAGLLRNGRQHIST